MVAMIKVNFRDGDTLSFDLSRDEDRVQWDEWTAQPDFQRRISGLGILHNKRFITLPYPKRFRRVTFNAELIYKTNKEGEKFVLGEQVICHADKVRFTLFVFTYNTQNKSACSECDTYPAPPVACRVSIEHVGKQLFAGKKPPKGGRKNG